MVEAAIGLKRGARRASGTPVNGGGELNVVLPVAVVLPGGEQVAIRPIDRDTREVVGTDEGARNALLRPAAEVAQGLTHNYVVADLDRTRAVQACRSGR